MVPGIWRNWFHCFRRIGCHARHGQVMDAVQPYLESGAEPRTPHLLLVIHVLHTEFGASA